MNHYNSQQTQKLCKQLKLEEENLFSPNLCPNEIVLLTHTEEYLNKLLKQTLSASEQRRIGFPQSLELTKRELIITKGTIDCCYYALELGAAMNIAGGTHHAFADKGEGFCLLNDMVLLLIFCYKKSYLKKY